MLTKPKEGGQETPERDAKGGLTMVRFGVSLGGLYLPLAIANRFLKLRAKLEFEQLKVGLMTVKERLELRRGSYARVRNVLLHE